MPFSIGTSNISVFRQSKHKPSVWASRLIDYRFYLFISAWFRLCRLLIARVPCYLIQLFGILFLSSCKIFACDYCMHSRSVCSFACSKRHAFAIGVSRMYSQHYVHIIRVLKACARREFIYFIICLLLLFAASAHSKFSAIANSSIVFVYAARVPVYYVWIDIDCHRLFTIIV